MNAAIGEVFGERGLSHAAGNLLAVIEGAGGPVTAGQAAEAMHITSGSMTSLVDTLEGKGLLQRFPDPTDRRRVLLDVTPEAEVLLDEVLPQVVVRAGQIAAHLSDDEVAQLIGLLDKVEAGVADRADPEAPHGRRRPTRLHAERGPDGRRLPADPPGG